MNGPSPRDGRLLSRGIERWLAVATLLVLGATAALYGSYRRVDLGKAQPIPFSHRVHAGEKQIGCLLCHEGALRAARASVPPLETCMLCHEHVAVEYPPIRELRTAYAAGAPMVWARVSDVPDHVYFDHSMHTRAGVDCGECHGNVKEMDRVEQRQAFKMGFCMDCHRERKAAIDCTTCHR